ncbi:MAG: D-tyrosyl-tRNA(Tyr) deacylase [Deltaproteobacteria bacterium]|nr:D-tyrosyl-tRNA(Tyr) deacylase [Deltaproteobacteria bacterium]MBI3293768.1 D-tyrosyl-tRNA(Tyr) deacylase [Deltaproteobacteria bacterium]
MRALIQRVLSAHTTSKHPPRDRLASIGPGLLILVGVQETDNDRILSKMVDKIANLRIFSDAKGKMNLSALQAQAATLWVSQITLFADCKGGNRPSFSAAGDHRIAERNYKQLIDTARSAYPSLPIHHTPFGSDLEIALINDGPVTPWLDSEEMLRVKS